MFLIGANPTEAHPVVGLEMKKALRKGARLIVCDPRETWMASRADIHIKHKPGTDNSLINAMMSHIVANDLYDETFVEARRFLIKIFGREIELRRPMNRFHLVVIDCA